MTLSTVVLPRDAVSNRGASCRLESVLLFVRHTSVFYPND